MFGKKKTFLNRNPSTPVEDDYFARFADGVFDPDADEIVSNVVNDLDGLVDSFPAISLAN